MSQQVITFHVDDLEVLIRVDGVCVDPGRVSVDVRRRGESQVWRPVDRALWETWGEGCTG